MTRATVPAADRHGDGLTSDYAPGQDAPLRPYAGVMAAYAASVAGAAALVRRRRYPLPDLTAADVALVGMATHKLSRLMAKGPVTSPLRAPFTRLKGVSGPAELTEEARGEGARKAVGELLTCPFCLSQWLATAFMFGLVVAPRGSRLTAGVFASLTVADFLQFAHAFAEQQT
ncbi:MAG: DUF1360 domain-containing protein [Actinomycetota bacterium]|nr:DUF1360 domain-containing protein [Actinomycetota bacterium]